MQALVVVAVEVLGGEVTEMPVQILQVYLHGWIVKLASNWQLFAHKGHLEGWESTQSVFVVDFIDVENIVDVKFWIALVEVYGKNIFSIN